MFRRIELISTPSIALDTIVRIILFSWRGCSARGGVAAEGTSRDKKHVEISINFSDPIQKCLCKPWKFLFFFFFFPGPSIEKLVDFVFLCRTTVRTCSFVSHAASRDVQQYSRVQQKSLSINNPRSNHVYTSIIHSAPLQQQKKRKRRGGIQLTLCPESSALPLSQQKCCDYLPSPGEQL